VISAWNLPPGVSLNDVDPYDEGAQIDYEEQVEELHTQGLLPKDEEIDPGLDFRPASVALSTANRALRADVKRLEMRVAELENPDPLDAAHRLSLALAALMSHNEDIEEAHHAYKLADLAITELEEIKKATLALGEAICRDAGLSKGRTTLGSYGFDKPSQDPKPKIDAERLLWEAEHNEDLRKLIEPYVSVPEARAPRFFFR